MIDTCSGPAYPDFVPIQSERNNMIRVFEIVGSIVLTYFAVRCFVTVIDIGQRGIRWQRGDKSAWDV